MVETGPEIWNRIVTKAKGRMSALAGTLRSYKSDESGTIVILAAVMLPVLIGGLGLGAEAGMWYYQQRQLQHAADVASHGAGIRKIQGDEQAEIEAAALSLAIESGFELSAGTITVNNPPTSGPNAGNDRAVEVLLTRDVPRAFTSIYSNDPVHMTARAVVALSEASIACVLALAPNKGSALMTSGGTQVTLTSCDTASNSIAIDAFDMQGSAFYTTGCVHTVGLAQPTDGLTITECESIHEMAPVTPDPYADVPEPEVVGSCTNGNIGNPVGTTTVNPSYNHPLGMKSIRFCNNVTFQGQVNLKPGLYILDGGNLSANAGALVKGTGVTFYFTDGALSKLNGNGVFQLTAPTSGVLSGILFFGDRSDPTVDQHINGGSASYFTGAIYFPSQHVIFNGNSGGTNACTQIIADTIEFTGASTISVECEGTGVKDIEVANRVSVVE